MSAREHKGHVFSELNSFIQFPWQKTTYLDSAPVGEGGEHGDAGTEHRPSTLQGEAIRDLDDEPDNHYDDES